MPLVTLHVEDATPDNIAPFGAFIGVNPAVPLFAEWTGVSVYGPAPVEIGSGGEILHVRMQAADFPARIALLERHFRHTQTYLSANGKPFVMVLGEASQDGLPDAGALRAFRKHRDSGTERRHSLRADNAVNDLVRGPTVKA